MIVDRTVSCPWCGERIAIALDVSVPEQEYVEDCSVCCRPIVINCSADDGEIIGLEVSAEGE